MKCSRCGLESDIQEAFLVRKRWAGLVKHAYCPGCMEKVVIREQLESVLLIALILAFLDAYTFRRGVIRIAADLLFLVAVNYPIIAAHELAHAAAGKALGVRVFKVTIGLGRLLFSRRVAGTDWELRLWPFGGGTVMACPPKGGSRARFFGAVLAGPAMHGVLIAAAVKLQVFLIVLQEWFGADVADWLHWTSLFLFLNLILLIHNLIPSKSGVSFGQLGTDGFQLLHLLFQKPEEEVNRNQAYYLLEAMDASARNDPAAALRWIDLGLALQPGQPSLRILKGNAFIKQKRFAEARALYEAMLSTAEAKQPYLKYLLYNNIAYAGLLLKDPEMLAEADRYSSEAIRQLGWEPAIIGTRGAVLAEMGRPDEGILLLQDALKRHPDKLGKASDTYHLAAAEKRRGNEAESRRYLELTRKYDPDFYLLDAPAEELPAA
ncbi:MAG: site-2 protease family protein [Anaerolineales bacterium]|nr:site-2 protease family protein [Anaerolineales bacterium]